METTKREIVVKAFSKDTFGIQSNDEVWYNVDKAIDNVFKDNNAIRIGKLNRGDTIELVADFQKRIYTTFSVTKKSENKSGWQEEITTLEDLLKLAHKKGLIEIRTELITIDLEKKYALFKAIVIGEVSESPHVSGTFQGHGDVTSENIGSDAVKKHWIRMAESRAICRALRWYVGEHKVAKEELSEEDSLGGK